MRERSARSLVCRLPTTTEQGRVVCARDRDHLRAHRGVLRDPREPLDRSQARARESAGVGMDGAKGLRLAARIQGFQRPRQQQAGSVGQAANNKGNRAHGGVPHVDLNISAQQAPWV
jgi:hypothetical protein